MRLDELIGTPYKYFQAGRQPTAWKWAFQTDTGVLYTVVVEMNKPGHAEFGFSAKAPGEEKFTTKATGTGDAFKVMATIQAIVSDFLNAYIKKHREPPQVLAFAGSLEEPSRLKLYSRLARNPDSWIPNPPAGVDSYSYKLAKEYDHDGYRVFALTRI